MELELTKQQVRLKYIDAMITGRDTCDFPPRRIYVEPTNHCNLRCGHCAAHNGSMTRDMGFLDTGLFRSMLDDIKDWNRNTELVLHQHGESTLHPRLPEMARMASVDYDFFTKLNTNGVALTREKSRELIHANIDYLIFSLDCITPESYERVKGRPNFHRVLNNVLDYLEEWGDVRREFPNYFACDIFLVEEDANRNDIPVIRKMFERLPVGHVEVYELFNYMGAVQEANGKYPERFSLPQKEWPCCNTPWDVVGVRWNGDVVACVYDFDSRYVIGNLNEASIRDIWNSERMVAFRKALLTRDYSGIETNGPLCSNCTIMWQKPYQAPTDFHAEISRMERYLSSAVDRVARRGPRTDDLLQRHAYLKANRESWSAELMSAIEPIRERYRAEAT